MKLLQLNTWSCKLAPEIVRLFADEQPSIVTMQEVISAKRGAKILDTIEDIFEEHSFEHQFYTPLVEFNFMHGTAQRGNMIASNSPIIETSQLWTSGSFIRDFDYDNSGGYNNARNVAHARIETNEGLVHVLTLHGYHTPGKKDGNEETLRACQQLVEYADALEGPVIITGDFNLNPDSKSIQHVNASYRNLTTEFGFETTRNHLTSKTEVCDYIFVNDKVNVLSVHMPSIIASDHNAIALDFNLLS